MIETTPNFILPNRFLIWVAKKFLAHCDLDLVLIYYDIEKLNSQLKNKETDTKIPVLTKLTKTTRLQLSTDQTLCKKLLLLRPSFFLPSPLFSPLSLSSNLILSSTIFLTSLYCFRPSFLLPTLHYPSVESCTLEMTSITNETKITKQGNLTPNGILLALVVQISYIMTMSYPRISDTFFFEDSNIIDFFT